MSLKGLIPQEDIAFAALGKRNIDLDVCRHYRYGKAVWKGKTVQVAQWCDDAGTVRCQKLRFADKSFTILGDNKYMGLFGMHLVRDGGERITITEGELDCLAVHQSMRSPWWPVVSLPNGASSAVAALKRDLQHLERFEEVILCFDEDPAGRKAVEECVRLFSPGKVRITRLPRKDACEMLINGEGTVLRSALYDSPKYRPEGLVSGNAIMDAIRNGGSVRGEPYVWEGLNGHLKGIRPKELIMLTAGTGSGKSTISRHIAHHLLETGHTVGYVALEESVSQSALGIYGISLQQSLQLVEDLPLDEIQKVHDAAGDRLHLFDHFGSSGVDLLLSKLRYLVVGLGCDVLFLDHITIAISGLALENERLALDQMMTQLRSLVESTGVTLFVISHLTRPKDGSHEEGKAISLRDLRGSQSLAQLSDIVLAAERDQQAAKESDRNEVVLRVLKNRPAARLGLCTRLSYDIEKGLLSEVALEKDKDPTNDFNDLQGEDY